MDKAEEYDGLELLVRFFANQGQLKKVEEKTGVPVKALSTWIDGGELPPQYRNMLERPVDPYWTGKIMVKIGDSLKA